jgi:hypothetical protein
MEVIKLENMGYYRDDMTMPGDIFLLQVSCILEFHSFEHIYLQSLQLVIGIFRVRIKERRIYVKSINSE